MIQVKQKKRRFYNKQDLHVLLATVIPALYSNPIRRNQILDSAIFHRTNKNEPALNTAAMSVQE